MQVKVTKPEETKAKLSIIVSSEELDSIKQNVLTKYSRNIKIAGFREGKAPLNLVEKQIDPNVLQSEFLETAVNQIYPQAVQSEKIRPVGNPSISIQKFVPFSSLEFDAEAPVVGKITLPNYANVKVDKPKVTVTVDDVNNVLSSLQKRMAQKNDVDRAAKDTDQIWIDFEGVDAKGKPIGGATGKNYPLVLGSNTFIPGFEPNLVGLSASDEKTFTLTFPKDYGAKALAGKKVTFTVKVIKVQEIVEPKLDDEFAKQSGPFETIKQLKDDIKTQLTFEKTEAAERDFESLLIKTISDKSKVAIPDSLIEEQKEIMLRDFKQNLTYRGQAFSEFLESEGLTEEEFDAKELQPQAKERVKASLVLTEISELEKIDVGMDEINERIAQLKAQYKDDAMRAELDKPEAINSIGSRIVTEKTLEILKGKSTKQ